MKVFMIGKDRRAPTRSAFCQLRNSISYEYFRDCFRQLINFSDTKRATFKGMRIYAIDGQQLTLPRAKDIVAHGFTGRAVSKYRETYMPRGYLTHAYDVLSGTSKAIAFNKSLNEQADAKKLIAYFEPGSLVLYDRLYFSKDLVEKHFKRKLKFIMRLRSNANGDIEKFFKQSRKAKTKIRVGEHDVYLIKVKNKKTNEWQVFACQPFQAF